MKILLLGLGRANMGVAHYLLERGEEVHLYEENPEKLAPDARTLIDQGKIGLEHNGDFDMVVSSPGFPPDNKMIRGLEKKGIPIIDEIEFTYQNLRDAKIIAITGTNGKSTTAALIHSIFQVAGQSSFLGGNIAPGIPFSHALKESRYEYYVLEISSFQLMRIDKFRPMVGVITNISPDHLNWHKDFNEYKNAKLRIFENQAKDDFAVLNIDDEYIKTMQRSIHSQIICFGMKAKDGAYLNTHYRYKDHLLFPHRESNLVGQHNIMNILAAIAVMQIFSIDDHSIESAISNFNPLPHRLEEVGVFNNIRYINNSMCTNEEAAIASFLAIKGNKIVILGGKEKVDTAHRYLNIVTQNAKACIVLGENSGAIKEYFVSKRFRDFTVARDMQEAVALAQAKAKAGDIILLNPGFASFGHFRNFEERGEAFRDAARGN